MVDLSLLHESHVGIVCKKTGGYRANCIVKTVA